MMNSCIVIFTCSFYAVWAADANETQVKSRSYGYGGGGGGGGYGGAMTGASLYNQGLFFSNFDTALTTLAVLSFGVFLLNMIFSFMDVGVPLGIPQGGRRRAQKSELEEMKMKTKRSMATMMDIINSQPQTLSSCHLGPLCPPNN